MRQLILCLISVALVQPWLAPPANPPFHMVLTVWFYDSPMIFDLWETPEGASFHLKYPELLGGGGGSGRLTGRELRNFQAGLESRGAWSLPCQTGSSGQVRLILTQGQRHRRGQLTNQSSLGQWLFAPEGLVYSCFERACQCPD